MSAIIVCKPLIPELVERRAEDLLKVFCESNTGRWACPHVNLLYEWAGDSVSLMFRDGCKAPQPIARFRYSKDLCQWTLFSPGAQADWRPCLNVMPTLNFERLLRYLEDDPLSLFWPTSFSCFS